MMSKAEQRRKLNARIEKDDDFAQRVLVTIYSAQTTAEQATHDAVIIDGVGFSKEVDFRNTESLGLQLVNTLTRQLDGTVELHVQDGTEFRIVFTAS